ncbi:MAG: chemotaxis protein [Magnetococcus sp. DMHC-6]
MATDMMSEVDKRANLAFSNEMEMLTFYLSDRQLYGLNVFKIIEILECPKNITALPQAHPCIKGAIDFRGRAIPLLDLSDVLGLGAINYKQELAYVLVCEYSTSIQGFLITQPNMLINKGWKDIFSPKGAYYDATYLTAITYHNEVTIQILDVEKILSDIIGLDDVGSEDLVEQCKKLVKPEHRVLAVDDSKAARMLIESALKTTGIKYVLFDNAQSALDHLEEEAKGCNGDCGYILILSDIEMPGMDGFTFTRKVKVHPQLNKVHLVLHSSLSNQSNRDKAILVGADDFIPKFAADQILTVVLKQIKKSLGKA